MFLFSKKDRILLKELVKTDFKLRYQGSLIGHLWSILKPIMLFSVMYLVFIHFLRLGQDIPHFAVALLLGMIMWNFFQETTSMGLTSIVARGDLLRKLDFPKEIVVISVSINAMINFLINLLVVIAFALINGVSLSPFALLAPLLFVELYIFSLGIAFLLATLFVRFRDIAPIWEVVMQAGMYATPIIYPITMVINTSPTIAKVMMMNPLAQIIQDARHLLISDQNIIISQMVSTKFMWIPYFIPFVVLLIGYSVFKHSSKKFAEIL
ncbi:MULTISPECIES: ABC transporter permease [unclassified Enterococcus]|uniref:ABC transporter permease n=1 Tax=unclassified Enterococcus TaxID=2608891 RepID=UPI0015567B59|nr:MULTISPECIES: ABC transporter permease [unclassified Enterococcus]MBS7577277.1 ABC transporter permease [Enterococcus sp. MMGLQ5-2]MBS7584630.1 ABC transporter permease [Enterococcus sp. MMGLQ5-1]NPD12485.1 ABC transporter permease [Enterococcus sp. MMGLQ5-1]NPD37111.1 ABC transporter permease [Enterococcus sp. MMGLQ5-2]